MTIEEQRLSELLKRSVPEPPFELSAGRVTVQHIDRSGRSWLMPVLAAAAVVLWPLMGLRSTATVSSDAYITKRSSASSTRSK